MSFWIGVLIGAIFYVVAIIVSEDGMLSVPTTMIFFFFGYLIGGLMYAFYYN